MSGLPTKFSRATSVTVYPGSVSPPWAGQPIIVVPVSDYYTPNTALAAEERNYIDNQITSEMSAIIDWSGNPALNFLPYFSMPATVAAGKQSCACWDPVNKQWLVGVTGSADAEVRSGQGQDTTSWTQYGGTTVGSATTLNSIVKDPTNAGDIYLGAFQSGAKGVLFKLTSGGVWTALGNNANASSTSVGFFNGVVVTGFNGLTGAGSTLCKGTGLTVAVTPSAGVTWAIKSGPNELLAIPAGTAGASPYLVRTTDGATFTVINITAGVLAATDQTADLVNLGGSTWLMIVNTNGTGLKVARSTDGGQTWAVLSTKTTPVLVQSTPIAAAFGQLVMVLNHDSSTVQTVIYSLDGGVTWYRSTSTVSGSGVSIFLAQGETGVCMSNQSAMRFSLNQGHPVAALT